VDGGTVRVFFLFGCVVAGTVRLKWWEGGYFLLLSLVCCQFAWRFNVCGRIFALYSSISFGEFVGFFLCGFCVLKVIDFQ
jgi:hypothetical protein